VALLLANGALLFSLTLRHCLPRCWTGCGRQFVSGRCGRAVWRRTGVPSTIRHGTLRWARIKPATPLSPPPNNWTLFSFGGELQRRQRAALCPTWHLVRLHVALHRLAYFLLRASPHSVPNILRDARALRSPAAGRAVLRRRLRLHAACLIPWRGSASAPPAGLFLATLLPTYLSPPRRAASALFLCTSHPAPPARRQHLLRRCACGAAAPGGTTAVDWHRLCVLLLAFGQRSRT